MSNEKRSEISEIASKIEELFSNSKYVTCTCYYTSNVHVTTIVMYMYILHLFHVIKLQVFI